MSTDVLISVILVSALLFFTGVRLYELSNALKKKKSGDYNPIVGDDYEPNSYNSEDV